MTKLLRIDGNGNIDYPMIDEKQYDWPFDTTLQGAVNDGRIRNLVTNFLRVGVKPEACSGGVESELEKLVVSKALSTGSKMEADYVALSKDSVREIQSRDTGDVIHATYVATFYLIPPKYKF